MKASCNLLALAILTSFAACYTAPPPMPEPVRAGTPGGAWLSHGSVAVSPVPESLLVAVPCSQVSGRLHVHHFDIRVVPNPHFRPGITTSDVRASAPVNISVDGNELDAYPHGHPGLGGQVFRAGLRLIPHDMRMAITYDEASLMTIQVSGPPQDADLLQPFVVDKTGSSALYYSLIQHDADLREAYRVAISASIQQRESEIRRLLDEERQATSTSASSTSSKTHNWLGHDFTKNIEGIRAIAAEGIIAPSTLPLPKLRNFLNQEIAKTVVNVSTW